MPRARIAVIAVLVTAFGSGVAGGQTDPPGQSKSATEVEKSAILPDAGKAGASAAPTMARDCDKQAGACNNSGSLSKTDTNAAMPEQSK